MNYTIICNKKGESTECGCHRGQFSIQEFGGFCERCWIKLTPGERSAIKGTELPQVEVNLKYPTYKPPFRVAGFFWKLAVTTLLGLLLWRDGLIAEAVRFYHQHFLHFHHHLFR